MASYSVVLRGVRSGGDSLPVRQARTSRNSDKTFDVSLSLFMIEHEGLADPADWLRGCGGSVSVTY